MYDIFISYRRKDTQGHARHLDLVLTRAFAPEQVFFDGRSIALGTDFREEIRQAITEARVVLVLIGREWLDEEGRRRLADPQDVVRREVALALEQRERKDASTSVIPILIDNPPDPTREALPEVLHGLLGLNYALLRGSSTEFAAELDRLIERIRQELGVPDPNLPTLDHVDKLPFLCNREKPEGRLVDLLGTYYRPEAENRPVLLVVHGNAGEAHDEFVDRAALRTIPRLLLGAKSVAPQAPVLSLTIPSELRSATDLPGAFRSQFARALDLEGLASLDALATRLAKSRYRIVVVRLAANSHELDESENTPFEVQHAFWSAFPPLPKGVLLVSFVTLVYSNSVVAKSAGVLDSLNPWGQARRRARLEEALRRKFSDLERQAPVANGVLQAVLPELTSPKISHVQEWARMQEVSRYVTQASRNRRSQLLLTVEELGEIFRDGESLPMADVGRRLQKLLEAYSLGVATPA